MIHGIWPPCGGPCSIMKRRSQRTEIKSCHFVMFDMMPIHDTLIAMDEATLTDRGQISIPAALRKAMNLQPGQRLKFAPVSDHEFRVIAENVAPAGPMAVLGYARKLRHGPARRTNDWMRELREGEKAS